MNDRLDALRLFVRVARTGSFSRAGRELGVSQSTASRQVAGLEHEIGAALLTRTTRAVSLTSAGAEYLARVEPILAALDEADQAARGAREVRGTLRVAVALSLATRVVIPSLPAFVARHPALRLDLQMDDSRHDLVRDGIDVALRFGAVGTTTATARRLGTNPRVLVASPGYLARAGTPSSPSELVHHAAVLGPIGMGTSAWSFERDGHVETVAVEGRLRASVNEGAVAAAVAGLGVLSTGFWGCRAELLSGKLVRLLAGWTMPPTDIHAVFPAGRAAKASARAFVDHVAGELAGEFARVRP